MKKILVILLLILLNLPTFAEYKPISKNLSNQYKQKVTQKFLYVLNNGIGGNLQQQYEKEKYTKYKDYKKCTATYMVQQDLKNYSCCRKSIYGEVIYLIDNADETNHRFLLQIKKNFDNCSKNLKCWRPIEIDDYNYNWLDNSTKYVIWFNNMVFLNK